MVLAVGVAIWAIASALVLIQESDRAADFWYDVALVGSTMMATSWSAMALQYTGCGALLTRRVIALLLIEPVGFLLLAFLTGHRVRLNVSSDLLFGVNNTYAYTLLAVGLFPFVRAFQRGHPLYSAQAASVVITVLLPEGANLLSVLGVWPPEFDSTPVAAAMGAAVLVWGLFKARLFDVVPIARDLVIETMQDGVIISDSQGRVVDINADAVEVISQPAPTVLGMPVADVLGLIGVRGNTGEFTERWTGNSATMS